jgi:succinoglycan biosynthesis transport protein ExoP
MLPLEHNDHELSSGSRTRAATVSDKQRPEGLDLPAIAGILRRRVGLILLCVSVTTLAAVTLALRQDKEYSATAALLFRDPGFDQRLFGSTFATPRQDPVRLLETSLQLVSLKIVAANTARRLGGDATAGEVSSKIKVSVKGSSDSDLASVTATDVKPVHAAALANTFATEYIDFRRTADREKLREAQRLVRRQLALASNAESSRVRTLERRAADLKILAALQTGNAELVERATPPGSPTSPRPRRNGLIGGFMGLLLGVALALGREQMDRRLKHPEELEEEFGLPLLASVPKSRELAVSTVDGEGAPTLPPFEGEAFRLLRANMRYFNLSREISSVLVTSPAAKDGKTTVALNLAVAAAETGTEVLLIEADLRAPALAQMLGVSAEKGLTTVLTEPDLTLKDVGWRIPAGQRRNGGQPTASDSSLDVVFAGPHPPNPTELLETDRMRELLRQAEADYSLVVVDAPPVTMVSDAIPLLTQVSGVLVVSRLGSNTRPLMKRLNEQLQKLEVPALGLVANFATEHTPHYGYPYAYMQREEPPRRRFRLKR